MTKYFLCEISDGGYAFNEINRDYIIIDHPDEYYYNDKDHENTLKHLKTNYAKAIRSVVDKIKLLEEYIFIRLQDDNDIYWKKSIRLDETRYDKALEILKSIDIDIPISYINNSNTIDFFINDTLDSATIRILYELIPDSDTTGKKSVKVDTATFFSILKELYQD